MSAPIQPARQQQPAALLEALAGQEGPRPQVRSRRVTLNLGPLGLTYATDQLVWPEAQDRAPPDAPPAQDPAGAGAQAAQASQAAQTPGPQGPRPFERDLDAARRQTRQDPGQAGTQTYGPRAARAARTQDDPGPEDPPPDAQDEPQTRSGPQHENARPHSRNAAPRRDSAMLRAIGAYLACARNFASPRPMLQAVA